MTFFKELLAHLDKRAVTGVALAQGLLGPPPVFDFFPQRFLRLHQLCRPVADPAVYLRLGVAKGRDRGLLLSRQLFRLPVHPPPVRNRPGEHHEDQGGHDELEALQGAGGCRLVLDPPLLDSRDLPAAPLQRLVSLRVPAVHRGHSFTGLHRLVMQQMGKETLGLLRHEPHEAAEFEEFR